MTMSVLLEKNDEKLIKGMEEYVRRLREKAGEDARQEAIQALIRTGVATEDGKLKKNIVSWE